MPEIGYFRKPEFTLGIFSIKLMLSKLFQYKAKMFSMFFLILGEYKDIIQINHGEFVEVFHEYVIHQARECSWSIGQAE